MRWSAPRAPRGADMSSRPSVSPRSMQCLVVHPAPSRSWSWSASLLNRWEQSATYPENQRLASHESASERFFPRTGLQPSAGSRTRYKKLVSAFWQGSWSSLPSLQALRTVVGLTSSWRAILRQLAPWARNSRASSRRKIARGRPTGLPDFVPRTRAYSIRATTRSRITLRSNSAVAPMMVNIALPMGVEVSEASWSGVANRVVR